MNMPKFTVTYFPFKGFAEPIRLMLAYGGEEFEDNRIPMEEWPAHKSKYPFGQLPILEIDGKQYAQSGAICRMLARRYNLVGDNEEEEFEINQIIDFYHDLRIKASMVHYEKDEVLKAQKHEENVKNVYPAFLEKLSEIINKNNGHLANGKLSWADFCFAGTLGGMKRVLQMPDLEKQYPAFQKVIDNVYSDSKVQAYDAAAPVTEF